MAWQILGSIIGDDVEGPTIIDIWAPIEGKAPIVESVAEGVLYIFL
jgi:hypothetical protein